MSLILGLSASLRGARHGKGLKNLCISLKELETKDDLMSYLKSETSSLLDSYLLAKEEGLPQTELLELLLHKKNGQKGLSNSEAALAAALWGAAKEGSDIEYCNLSHYFPESGSTKHLKDLEKIVLNSDGFILSGPVYFGDRSSLAQEFIEFLSKNKNCLEHIKNKVYGGLAVGAKRNGGQETALVYQLIDMINLNMLGVGNNSETSSQYGGTVVAGDIGSVIGDEYGIDTSIGTGKRVARISRLSTLPKPIKETKRAAIEIWLVQDKKNKSGLKYIEKFVSELKNKSDISIKIRDFTDVSTHRCIACDICPISSGPTKDYRCIITKKSDLFVQDHEALINADAILLAAYSPVDKTDVISVYQKFIERTRYIRRDNYALGDLLMAPLVISEVNSNQNLHIRMTTSLIRHHSIIHHPILMFENSGNLLNWDVAKKQAELFIHNAKKVVALQADTRKYNPVGYIISAEHAKSLEKEES
jgi:multimeric flavodoxin WrbA